MMINLHSRHCERVGLLLLLCAVASGASAVPQNTKGSGAAARRTVRESEAIAPWLVSSDQGLGIIGAALESRRHMDSNADCSNLVHAIYERAGFTYSYANSSELYRGIKEFRRVIHPQPGDLVVWPGHVGIVISPVQHSFFSAMRSGRGVEFYDSPYWQRRGRPRFFRYLKAASRTQSSASTRNANLKRSSLRNAEAHDPVPAEEDSGPTPGVSGISPATGTSKTGPNENESASGTVPADAVGPAGVSKTNQPAALSAVDAPQVASLHNSESQATRDAPSATDRNKPMPTGHKLQVLEEVVWEKTATKPSAGIPCESVDMPAPHDVPRPPQGFGVSNMAAMAGHVRARMRSEGGQLAKESRSEPPLMAMSRTVPRPPWSSTSRRISAPSVPRPPAGRVPRASQGSPY